MQQSQSNGQNSPLDSIMVTIAVVAFLGGFYLSGSLFLAGQPWYIRLLVVLGGIVLAAGALWLTSYRTKLISLAKGARIELLKVHWPSKDEVVKTTMLVLAIVTVFAIFLSLVDWILTAIIQWVL